jgi:thiamine transport system substrate-binding protein
VALEDGVSLLNRLRMEGKNSKADVVLGLDNNLLEAATQSKLFAKSQVPASAVTVPGGWDNDTFVPFDYGYFAFVYDKNKLKNPPKSLKELVESDQKWRVIYEDPRTSTPGLGLLLWMQKVYGEKSPEAWQKLAAKTVTVTKGWSEAYGLFLKGESDLVLSYTTSPAYHIIEEKKTSTRPPVSPKATICRLKSPRVPPPANNRSWRRNSSSLWCLRLPECHPDRQLDVSGHPGCASRGL